MGVGVGVGERRSSLLPKAFCFWVWVLPVLCELGSRFAWTRMGGRCCIVRIVHTKTSIYSVANSSDEAR